MPTNNAWNSTNLPGVPSGGTGLNTTVAYSPVCGGTTATSALQSVASVGTTGQVLTSTGTGSLPTFQTFSGGPVFGYTSGKYYRMGFSGRNTNNINIGSSANIVLYPFYVNQNITIDKIAFEVQAFGAGGNFKCAIYNQSNSKPTTVLLDAGAVAVSANAVYEYTVSQALVAGTFYFVALLSDYNPTLYGFTSSRGNNIYPVPLGTAFTTVPGGSLTYARAYASGFLDLTGLTLFNASAEANIQFRVA